MVGRLKSLLPALATVAAALAIATVSALSTRPGQIVHGLEAPSATLGRPISYVLYKPSQAPAAGGRWPVLYLYHGLGEDERDWIGAGQAALTLDRLIAARRLKPLLVVMPSVGDSWYVDNPDPGGSGRMAAALSQDLVRHVDSAWPTAACREARAVGGLSTGGYGALLYAFDSPERFAAAMSFSGRIYSEMSNRQGERAGRATGMFGGDYGDPFDSTRFNQWNLFPRIPKLAASPTRPALYLAVGRDDFPSMIRGNARLNEELRKAGVAAAYRVDPGGRGWGLWSRQLEPALEWLDEKISADCRPAAAAWSAR